MTDKGLSERLRMMASVFVMDPRNKQVIAEAADALDVKDRQIEALAGVLEGLNAEIDAFWNEPPEVKYQEGSMNPFYVQAITLAQGNCRAALAAVKKEQTDGE